MRHRSGWPTVSVVVPSSGRACVRDAVASVAAQDYPGEVETVVVLDGQDPDTPLARSLQELGVVVRATGRRLGANGARNRGAEIARGELLAYLDDDDVWHPAKLRTQVHAVRCAEQSGELVASCRVQWRRPGASTLSRPVPDVLPVPDERVEDYLFRRRRASLGRALLHTSSLLVPRPLALTVRWDETLTRHQDWDWLVRLQDTGAARFVMCPEPLVTCSVGSPGSISATADWAASLDWVERRGNTWARATRADFLVAQPLRYAVQGRSLAGVRAVLAAVLRSRGVPSWSAMTIAAGGLLPRGAFERAALLTGRHRDG